MNGDFISEDEFRDDWGVIRRSTGDLFEHEDVKDKPLNNVWTIVESGSDEDDTWYASPGFHLVNRLGYVLTQKAWTNDSRDAIYFLDDGDGICSVFVYRTHDANGAGVDGLILLAGDCDEQLHVMAIDECCETRGRFIAEQIGIPVLYADSATSGGSATDSQLFHEFVGLCLATDEEAKTLPLWGRTGELVWKFREASGK